MNTNQLFVAISLQEKQPVSARISNQRLFAISFDERHPASGWANNQRLCTVSYKYFFAQYHIIKETWPEAK